MFTLISPNGFHLIERVIFSRDVAHRKASIKFLFHDNEMKNYKDTSYYELVISDQMKFEYALNAMSIFHNNILRDIEEKGYIVLSLDIVHNMLVAPLIGITESIKFNLNGIDSYTKGLAENTNGAFCLHTNEVGTLIQTEIYVCNPDMIKLLEEVKEKQYKLVIPSHLGGTKLDITLTNLKSTGGTNSDIERNYLKYTVKDFMIALSIKRGVNLYTDLFVPICSNGYSVSMGLKYKAKV